MSGMICLATIGLLVHTPAFSAVPPDANSIVIDDFESYTDEAGNRIFQIWIDGWGIDPPPPGCPGTESGATVGHLDPPFAERDIVHTGRQSMPLDYNNIDWPYYSETERCYYWEGPHDWTVQGMNTLSLWFRGQASNSPEPFYVALQDGDRWTGVVKHPDPNALRTTEWQQWQIRLTTFAFGPADLTAVKQFYIGIGDRQKPQPGGAGIVYIDDICLVRCAPLPTPNEPDFFVIDDFESYTDDADNRIFQTWINGWDAPEQVPGYPDDCTGALVGYVEPPFAEQSIVHGGRQSMPLGYENIIQPHYSEAFRQWETLQDWIHIGIDTLSLWFRGEASNSPEPLYVALKDNWRTVGVVNHPDPNALRATEWQQWQISLATLIRDHVETVAVKRMYIGVGDRQKPKPGGTGILYVDDIRLIRSVRPTAPAAPDVAVLDDFESYTDDLGNRICQTWLDGWTLYGPGGGTNSLVGHMEPPYAEQEVVRGGRQSMPVAYNNLATPYYSEVERRWARPQDWTLYEANSLSLWFRGEAMNSPEPFYVALEDSKRRIWAVSHPALKALLATEWQQWRVPLLTFVRNRVDIAAIQRMYIGIGDRRYPTSGGAGTIYIDDITLTK